MSALRAMDNLEGGVSGGDKRVAMRSQREQRLRATQIMIDGAVRKITRAQRMTIMDGIALGIGIMCAPVVVVGVALLIRAMIM